MRPTVSIRWKITLVLTAVTAITTAVLGAVTYRSTDDRLLAEIDRSIEQAGELMVANSDRLGGQRQVLDVYSIRRINGRGIVGPTTFEVDLPVDLGVAATVAGQVGATTQQTVTAPDGERFRLHTAGLRVGAVQVARSLDETDAVLDDLRRRSIFLVTLASLLSAIVGWLVAGRVAAPLRRLAATADEVRTTGRLDVDLADTRSRSAGDEVGQLRSAMASMLDALGRSRADQERLVQDAGHELRTPLTSLRTNLAVMRRHENMPTDMRAQIVNDLDMEVSELTDLVNELVTVASGELAAQPAERLDVAAMARTVADRVGRRRSRTVHVNADADCFVSAPRAGIDRAISNLVENACKFDPSDGDIEIAVHATDDADADLVEVRVRDGGIGVPEDERQRIFDRFHRTEATRAMAGSGLGLAMVRDIAEAHGGSVSVRDRADGDGADIGFSLSRVT